MSQALSLLWVGALLLFGLDYGIGGWSNPEPHFRFWTYIGGPLFLLTVVCLHRQAKLWLWVATTATALGWGLLWFMTSCAPGRPETHDCYQTLAQAWLTLPLLLMLYAGFPLAVTIAAVGAVRYRTRSRRPRGGDATA